MGQHTVEISRQHHAVRVYQVAKNVWIADGEFLSAHLRVRGSTAGNALRAWRKAAIKKTPNDRQFLGSLTRRAGV
jgi:acyl-[acyl carrier protein]--UDP-N-acetylglucosamine O-acyltransferase